MKRFLILLACAALFASAACAEALPGTSPAPAAEAAASESELSLDFSLLTPDNPAATPIPVDPIDKPTPTPMPKPNFHYDTYSNNSMGVSFSIPYTWLLNPNTNHDTTVQFVEPKSEMMDPDGYQTRITIEKYNMGLNQTADDARATLDSVLEELAASFTSFTPNAIDSASFGEGKGHYCYYRAEYNDGSKLYEMNGRVIVIAYGKALYQIRLTTPRDWYSYYNYVWREVRSSFRFQ